MIERYQQIYRALNVLGNENPEIATPAVASLRLLLIDSVGEAEQRRLIGQWNDDPIPVEPPRHPLFRWLAADGIAFQFVSTGMPTEWARRHMHLFQYMPPVHEPLDSDECMARREGERQARNYARARDAGNMLLALAVLNGDAAGIVAHATENLAILNAWRHVEPDLGRDYEFEEHAWLRDHATDMARWGVRVQGHLEMMVR